MFYTSYRGSFIDSPIQNSYEMKTEAEAQTCRSNDSSPTWARQRENAESRSRVTQEIEAFAVPPERQPRDPTARVQRRPSGN